jgi:hydrogenase 3 maturation protease
VVDLKPLLKGRVVVLGIGNTLKQDDGAGPAVIAKIKNQKSKIKKNVELLDGGSAPENYTGKIKQIKPDTLVVIDTVDFGSKPGSIRIIEEKEIRTQSLSTHNVSLKTYVDYLKADLPDLAVMLVGIQPKQVGFGEGLSPEVKKAVDELCMSLV